MHVVILCGGKGTRLKEHTEKIPKPLVKVGNRPILWHIMKYYSSFGHNDFILCLGYKGHLIRDYFEKHNPGWNINFLDTGLDTKKGERLRMAEPHIQGDDFFLAYGDDLSDIDIHELFKFHREHSKTVTLTAVNPRAQFGIIDISDKHEVVSFKEKPPLEHWINGGYFVMNKSIFNEMKEGWDLEKETFKALTEKKEIMAFRHTGYWQAMNTIKDVHEINTMWEKKQTPWKK